MAPVTDNSPHNGSAMRSVDCLFVITEQDLKQTFGFLMIWVAMTLIWLYVNEVSPHPAIKTSLDVQNALTGGNLA